MTDKTRIKVAAIVTALFLGGISAVGLAARSDSPGKAASAAAAPAAVQAPTTAGTGSVALPAQSPTYEDERYADEPEASTDEPRSYDDERSEERGDDD